MNVTPELINATLRIFGAWLVRDRGWTYMEAIAEKAVLLREINKTGLTELNYVRMSRIGARKTTNRKDRMGLQLTFENAINHGTFEVGME